MCSRAFPSTGVGIYFDMYCIRDVLVNKSLQWRNSSDMITLLKRPCPLKLKAPGLPYIFLQRATPMMVVMAHTTDLAARILYVSCQADSKPKSPESASYLKGTLQTIHHEERAHVGHVLEDKLR
jgi:hypothetical protein